MQELNDIVLVVVVIIGVIVWNVPNSPNVVTVLTVLTSNWLGTTISIEHPESKGTGE